MVNVCSGLGLQFEIEDSVIGRLNLNDQLAAEPESASPYYGSRSDTDGGRLDLCGLGLYFAKERFLALIATDIQYSFGL
jgi:hypothetical protein